MIVNNMLNNKNNINQEVFSIDVEQVPLRNGFGEGLVEAAEKNTEVVGLCADLTDSTRMNAFAEKYPGRFIEIGVAEQNLAVVASGMAAMGKIPFLSSYAMFSPGRNWEQIRTTICYNDQKVIIVGSHAGISVGPDGGTHQALEDIAIMRVIPRMTVVVPCDTREAKKATLALADNPRQAYLRLAREKTPVMTTQETPFEIGKAYEMYRSEKPPKVALIGCGPVLHSALNAARVLDADGIGAVVLNVHTIKPLDEERVVSLARECGAVVTIEEHQVTGGLGGAVAEVLARHAPTPMRFVGVHDRFGQSGEPSELLAEYGIDEEHVVKMVQDLIG